MNGNNLEPTDSPDLDNRVALAVQSVKVWSRSGVFVGNEITANGKTIEGVTDYSNYVYVTAGRPVTGDYILRINDADGKEIYADSGAAGDTAVSFKLWNSDNDKLDAAYRAKSSAAEVAGWYTYYLQIGVEYYYGAFLIK